MDRAWLLPLVALLLVAPVAAHGEHDADCDAPAGAWTHIRVWNLTLEPGADANRTLAFSGCPLQADWLVLVRAEVVGGTVDSVLRQANDTLGAWTWPADDGAVLETVRLPHTDFLELALHNPGTTNVTVRIYYDQTCLCPVKGVWDVHGPVWMNALANAGDAVTFDVSVVPIAFAGTLPAPGNVTVRAQHVAVGPGFGDRSWPDGVTVLDERTWTFAPATAAPCREEARWIGCFSYSFAAVADGRQDVLLWLAHDGGPSWTLQVRPVIDVQPLGADGGLGVPGLGVGGVVGVLVVAAALVVARRS